MQLDQNMTQNKNTKSYRTYFHSGPGLPKIQNCVTQAPTLILIMKGYSNTNDESLNCLSTADILVYILKKYHRSCLRMNDTAVRLVIMKHF